MHTVIAIESFVLNLLASWPFLVAGLFILMKWSSTATSKTPLREPAAAHRRLFGWVGAAHVVAAPVNVWIYVHFLHMHMNGVLGGTTPNGTEMVGKWLTITAPIAVLLLIEAIAVAVYVRRHDKLCQQIDQDRLTRAREQSDTFFRSHHVIGTAGGSVVEAAGKFGMARALAGLAGEAVVAARLEQWVMANPGSWLFHDLVWPGGDTNANIDHVLVTGGSVIVIDAKNWKPGVYTRDGEGLALRDGQPFPPADKVSTFESVVRLRQYLSGTGTPAVSGTTVVRPSGHGTLEVSGLNGYSQVPYVRLRELTLPAADPDDFPLDTLLALEKLVISA